MSDTKTKRSIRNVVTGFALKVFQMVGPFVVRTAVIKVLGMEYLGLNSLFISILQVLNLAELGVGTAMVVGMYKPIAENDTETICKYLNLYRKYYRIIGCIVLGLGIVLIPFLPWLIAGDIPSDVNLYVLYCLNLAATVLSYWLFAYKNSLFMAHQRNDVINIVSFIIHFATYSLQIVLLFLTKNYYTYVIVLVITQVANNLITTFLASKFYPTLKPVGSLEKEKKKKLNQQIRDLFYGQLGFIVTNSVDTIVISAFLGLVPLALYQNYYYILSAIAGFFSIFFVSIRAGIGTNIVTKSKKDNATDFKFITFIVFAALTFCTSCLISLYQPFMQVWVGEDNMLDTLIVVLFGAYLFVLEVSNLIGCYKDSSGIWHADRFRPAVTALVNLSLNLLLVSLIGLYGILISTIVSYLFVNIPWLYHRLFIDVFDKTDKREIFISILLKTVISLLIIAFCYFVSTRFNDDSAILVFFIRLVICSTASLSLYFILNLWDSNYKRALRIARSFLLKCRRNKQTEQGEI